MPDITAQTFVTKDPGIYNYALVGTAASIGTIQNEPCFFRGIVFNARTASGSVTIFDSIGTSLNVIGTIVVGTSTAVDPPSPQIYNVATKNALSVQVSANIGVTVLYK